MKETFYWAEITPELIEGLENGRYVCKSDVGTYEYDLEFIKDQRRLMHEILLPVPLRQEVTEEMIEAEAVKFLSEHGEYSKIGIFVNAYKIAIYTKAG